MALLVAALFLVQAWLQMLALAASGNPFEYLNYKLQPVGTYVLAFVVYFGTLAWVVAMWRHVVSRWAIVRRLLGLRPL